MHKTDFFLIFFLSLSNLIHRIKPAPGDHEFKSRFNSKGTIIMSIIKVCMEFNPKRDLTNFLKILKYFFYYILSSFRINTLDFIIELIPEPATTNPYHGNKYQCQIGLVYVPYRSFKVKIRVFYQNQFCFSYVKFHMFLICKLIFQLSETQYQIW